MRAGIIIVLLCSSLAIGDVFNIPPGLTSLETVPVGNPGNAGDTRYPDPYNGVFSFGSVAYEYRIGKYEVTAGQYTEFLNAVAKTDTFELYSPYMADTTPNPYRYGCNIQRSGEPGSYTYSVASDWANRPVNHVSWGDAARFTNWLANGQKSGLQDPTTTEDGSYALNGAISDTDLMAVTRKANATWVITSEDEWYKAAYYKGGLTNAGYFDYPTSSDAVPSNAITNPDSGNNANYYDYHGTGNGTWSTGSPYYRTEVGEFENSDSAYGTFDQGGNVWEWNESVHSGSARGFRGGSFIGESSELLPSYRWGWVYYPTQELYNIGFRIAYVPEPASLLLLALGGVALTTRRIRRGAVAVIPVTLVALLLSATSARANVFNMPAGLTSLEMVTVGNPGNAGELSGQGAGGFGPDRICGAVDYEYRIGKYEVTAGQYTEFLNAVAKTDAYGLYNPYMWAGADGRNCGIQRSGLAGSYTYSVAPDWANRPVNYVSWGDAARFANWLHNGQPAGPQNTETTEEGAYYLNGATSITDLMAVTRNANATWVIPTEDEWYKAAYHKNDGVTGNYWDYPTGTNSEPSNALIDPDPGNNATFYGGGIGYTIGSPYYRTEVGAHENSESPYGTLDQGGNIREWNETVIGGSDRGTRGGSFMGYAYNNLWAAFRYSMYPTYEDDTFGFRIAFVPEPASLLLLALGGLPLTTRRIRRGAVAVIPVTLVVLLLSAASARANVFDMPAGLTSLEMVMVGNPGNAPDTEVMNDGTSGYGAVGYTYGIGKFEVTAGQYCQFLNAVAKTDTYGLYNPYMADTTPNDYGYGCNIQQSGSAGSCTYSVAPDWANRPVNYVSWGDAARFSNWLSNGQPTGAQDASTTEDGSYALNGAISDAVLMAVTRKANSKWAIPTEDEWYKAAYHKNDGAAGNYWDYPTCSDTAPGRDMVDVSGNNANYPTGSGPYPIDSPHYTTVAGEFQNSDSPYGTFDQGGNVWEWNEAVLPGYYVLGRGQRGGSFVNGSVSASTRNSPYEPTEEFKDVGFRVAEVPEPATLALLAIGGMVAIQQTGAKRRRPQ